MKKNLEPNSFSSAMQNGAQYLENFNIENPRLNAQLLLCEICNIKPLDILLANRLMSASEVFKYQQVIERRATHEPLQYICGSVDFYGLKIEITSDVLIPRPETEQLVEYIINKELLKNIHNCNILDIGTGSGCIALALAKNFPHANVTGIDISSKAISVALRNKKNINLRNINMLCVDVSKYLPDKKFDMIISNPPYISYNDYENLSPELYFEPKIALTDAADGLTFYRIIADRLNILLNQNGKLLLEFGFGQENELADIFSKYFKNMEILKDFNNISRFLLLHNM